MPVFDEKTAASYLGLSVRTLQKRRFQCMQPGYYRIGKSIRYSQEELDLFLEQHRIVPGREGQLHPSPMFIPAEDDSSHAKQQTQNHPAHRFTPATGSRKNTRSLQKS